MLERNTRRLGLADRLESILRTDRHALRRQQSRSEGMLLALVSRGGGSHALIEPLLKESAAESGLSFLAIDAEALTEIPRHYLDHASLVVADVSGRNERVITLVYQAMGCGCRLLLCGQEPTDIPSDLEGLSSVFIRGLEDGLALQRQALESMMSTD